MATIKSEYNRFNGSDWDIHYFKTSADIITETTGEKVLTAAERTKISDYLTSFNSPNKLLQLNASSKIDETHIPALSYLSDSGGSLSGALSGTSASFSSNLTTAGDVTVNGAITSDSGVINIEYVGGVDFHGAKLQDISNPSSGTDGANKNYVDSSVSAGMRPVPYVVAATTVEMEFTSLSGLTTIDGHTLNEGDRVLVWKQTDASQNGIYTASTTAWSKVTEDSDSGAYVFVENGNYYNDWYFHCQDNVGTWIPHGRPDTVKAGSGLTKAGNYFNIESNAITSSMIDDVDVASLNTFSFQDNLTSYVNLVNPGEQSTLTNIIGSLASAIKKLRGTSIAYNTYTDRTIESNYALAKSKTLCGAGSSLPLPADSGQGDLYFKSIE